MGGALDLNQAIREEAAFELGLNKTAWGWTVGDLGEGCLFGLRGLHD